MHEIFVHRLKYNKIGKALPHSCSAFHFIQWMFDSTVSEYIGTRRKKLYIDVHIFCLSYFQYRIICILFRWTFFDLFYIYFIIVERFSLIEISRCINSVYSFIDARRLLSTSSATKKWACICIVHIISFLLCYIQGIQLSLHDPFICRCAKQEKKKRQICITLTEFSLFITCHLSIVQPL